MSLESDLSNRGFQVKYLGSVSFIRKKRQPLKGIVSLQRPLLDLYTCARRRGESHRSVHPLALTQQLEVCDYGLVVAEGTSQGETVLTKVITPLSNVVLWAAVRFHARIVKRRALGAAFVPLACSEGVLDHKSYNSLTSRQRFLVSLSHPSVFACIYRNVSKPTIFECHAFVCATAEDALAVASLATQQGDSNRRQPLGRMRRIAASVDSGGTDYYTSSDVTTREMDKRDYNPPFREHAHSKTDTEEESNSYASVVNKASSPVVGRRRYIGSGNRHLAIIRPRKKYMKHREARALIGRAGEPGRPLPEDLASLESRKLIYGYDRGAVSLKEDRSTMTEESPTEVLAETIDLSSEGDNNSSSSGGWKPLPTSPLVKYTYFGYEAYAPATTMPEKPAHMQQGVIQNNGTGKVTINVSYRPDSRASSISSRNVPHGVRTFQKNGHVRNWSSLSQTSVSSTNSSYPPHGLATTLPPSRPHHAKVIRWSSEDRLPRRKTEGGFFWSLKRFSIQSLTKAKHKTGKFIINMKTRLMGMKRSSADGSEDSAYDTSEVCLSPSGRQAATSPSRPKQTAPKTRRQQSWSFHDLRSAAVERPVVVRKAQHSHKRRRRTNSSRRASGQVHQNCSSSSDSGVEAAYHSDNSGRKSASDPGRLAATTRVVVEHGMGNGTFQRWSHTNIKDELGYMP